MPHERILVVDDELHVLAVLSTCLERAGYTVQTADNAREGLEAALAAPPDLVITDYLMSEMDGLQFVHQLRRRQGNPDLPIVMITARGHCLPQEEISACNICLISKPFSPSELLAAIRDLLAPRHSLSRRSA